MHAPSVVGEVGGEVKVGALPPLEGPLGLDAAQENSLLVSNPVHFQSPRMSEQSNRFVLAIISVLREVGFDSI